MYAYDDTLFKPGMQDLPRHKTPGGGSDLFGNLRATIAQGKSLKNRTRKCNGKRGLASACRNREHVFARNRGKNGAGFLAAAFASLLIMRKAVVMSRFLPFFDAPPVTGKGGTMRVVGQPAICNEWGEWGRGREKRGR